MSGVGVTCYLWKCLCVCVLSPKFTQKYLVRGLSKISVFACFIRLSVKGILLLTFCGSFVSQSVDFLLGIK